MYINRNAVAYLPDGVTLATRVMVNPNGTYSMQLPAGSYQIQIQTNGTITGEKKSITITKNKTTVTDFDIAGVTH